jgi:hypothetical protein
MNIPTYYEGAVKDVSFENGLTTMWLSSDRNGDLYDIYYCGEITEGGYIAGTEFPELIIAKSIKSGDEIVVFDGAAHGYDNMLWQTHDEAVVSNRKTRKYDIQPVKVQIAAEYSVDYEAEKDDYEFIDDNHISTDHNKSISWSELKRNGITWLTVTLTDSSGKETCIVDSELA